jgi:hypothetical protein
LVPASLVENQEDLKCIAPAGILDTSVEPGIGKALLPYRGEESPKSPEKFNKAGESVLYL